MQGWTARLALGFLVLPGLAPGEVFAAPAPLRGISVDLSWTDSRTEKFLDTG